MAGIRAGIVSGTATPLLSALDHYRRTHMRDSISSGMLARELELLVRAGYEMLTEDARRLYEDMAERVQAVLQ